MAISADRLKQLRKVKGVTQKQLAEILGITERHYRKYEAGAVDPPTSTSVKLSDYFNVSLDYLVGKTDNPEINK